MVGPTTPRKINRCILAIQWGGPDKKELEVVRDGRQVQ